ncbi:hypothetical protein HYU19_01765 [Candidatus Woesearchaeota archaeon]|nr:hypothetical protein [Candidatus Woesearchaeota archaeon]
MGVKTGVIQRMPTAKRPRGVIRSDDGTLFDFTTANPKLQTGIAVRFIDDAQGNARGISISKRSHSNLALRRGQA